MVVKVRQNPEKEVPTEVLAEAIVAISAAMKKLRDTRLTDRTLYMLIADAAPPIGVNPSKYVSAKDVKAVLQGIADLEKVHLKKTK